MLLSVEKLRVSYGNIKALHGLNFEIDDSRNWISVSTAWTSPESRATRMPTTAMPIKIEMIAITTSSSTSVKAIGTRRRRGGRVRDDGRGRRRRVRRRHGHGRGGAHRRTTRRFLNAHRGVLVRDLEFLDAAILDELDQIAADLASDGI